MAVKGDAVTNKHTPKLHHVGFLYILTYDARKLRHKTNKIFVPVGFLKCGVSNSSLHRVTKLLKPYPNKIRAIQQLCPLEC